jgi:hypothetical protein
MDERTPSPQPRAGSTDDDGTVNSAEEGNDDLSTGARDEGPDGYVTIGGAFEVQLMALPAAAKLVSGYWCMCAFQDFSVDDDQHLLLRKTDSLSTGETHARWHVAPA